MPETRPLRLLFVSHSFPPSDGFLKNLGGMQRVATELFEAFERHPGVDVHPLVLRTSWKTTALRTPVFLLQALRTIPRRIRQEHIDVLLFSSMVTATLAPLLRRRGVSIPMAAIVHGQDITFPFGPYQRYIRWAFSSLDAILPVSRATAAAVIERGASAARVHVVPNGIRPDRMPFCPVHRVCRQELHEYFPDAMAALPEDALLLCSVGRQVRRKGFHWFIEEVMPRLPERVHYWLAGDGPMHGTLRTLIHGRGLERRVHLLGRVSEEGLQALYRGADLFVMPNIPVPGDMEGFGVVMLEAGLAGLPVVAADLEGIRDVIAEGVNGHLVPPLDADGFARRIADYLSHPEEAETCARRARTYVLEHFSWEAVADRYLERLTSLARAVPVPTD